MKKNLFVAAFAAVFCFGSAALASDGEESWFSKWKSNVSAVADSSNYDLYIPAYAWHNRLTYDQEHIDKYNENPWGAGVGKHIYDDNGHWHALYAMAFKDSNKHLETIFGYAYQHNWYFGEAKDFNAGIGYTLSLTQRSEYAYIPVPLPLPVFGVGYKKLSVQAAYVPGVKNDGNVLFTWVKIEL